MSEHFHTVVCAATGPSFTGDQPAYVERARAENRCRVIAISDNWKYLPNADVLYACDGKWWDYQETRGIPRLAQIKLSGFKGELWTQSHRAATGYMSQRNPRHGGRPGLPPLLGVHYIRGTDTEVMGRDRIFNGKNSGCQGMGLARIKYAPKKIVLVGYDMQKTNGKQHNFGDHPAGLSNELPFADCIKLFGIVAKAFSAAGIQVVNATSETALTCFPRIPLEQAL